MARRGSVKQLSEDHEEWVASRFGGTRSKSSGAAEHDAGDVRSHNLLIECKMTGHPGLVPKRLPAFIKQLEKITHEAWSESRDPVLALRYYAPGHALSGPNGWIDVVVMRTVDIAVLEKWNHHDD